MFRDSENTDNAEDQALSFDEIAARLQAKVDERKALGEYPADIEAKLDEHFRRVVHHRQETGGDAMERVDVANENVHNHSEFTKPVYTTASSKPGGDILRKAVINVVEPSALRAYEEQQEFAIALREAFCEIQAALQNPYTHVHADLVDQLDALSERLDSLERRLDQLDVKK